MRTLDPEWRPTPSWIETVEGLIRHTEANAREARARYEELRRGIGGNFGPPLTPPSAASTPQPIDGPAWIETYRIVHARRDLFGKVTGLRRNDTVAVTELDGRPLFGVNSLASTYTAADRATAQRAVDALVRKYPGVMSTGNIGHAPNDALFHAESTILLRAVQANGGSLAGRSLTIYVDRDICRSCRTVLPKLGLELGNPTVIFVGPADTVQSMRNGGWVE